MYRVSMCVVSQALMVVLVSLFLSSVCTHLSHTTKCNGEWEVLNAPFHDPRRSTRDRPRVKKDRSAAHGAQGQIVPIFAIPLLPIWADFEGQMEIPIHFVL